MLTESEANMLNDMAHNKQGGYSGNSGSKGYTGKIGNHLGKNGKTIAYDDESSNRVEEEDMDEEF